MLEIQEDVSLKAYNSFGLDVNTRLLAAVGTVEEFRELRETEAFLYQERLILGGGSNVLFTRNFPGLVIKNEFKGLKTIEEDGNSKVVEIGAGENWHEFVVNVVGQGLGGVENLSLIPGTVGAAPMQNIGAYGVELKEVFVELTALNLETGELNRFDTETCKFGYRTSIFKTSHRNKYLITSVTLRLSKDPQLNLSYSGISEKLKEMDPSVVDVKSVSDAVIEVRRQKLPDPEKIGNAGSFFKNPVISKSAYDQLKSKYPEIPSYPAAEGQVKVPAGWLIEKCGWKGKRIGDIGVHQNQALVLVNYGSGRGDDLRDLAADIQASVLEQFGISLEPEVNIV